jgi:Reverse transcriptase (RNA-dependent DNA polymerase)
MKIYDGRRDEDIEKNET